MDADSTVDSGICSTFDLARRSVLELWHHEPGRRWSLRVQEAPRPAIILEGVEPTLEEVVRVLASTPFPVCMVHVVMVMAACAERPADGGAA